MLDLSACASSPQQTGRKGQRPRGTTNTNSSQFKLSPVQAAADVGRPHAGAIGACGRLGGFAAAVRVIGQGGECARYVLSDAGGRARGTEAILVREASTPARMGLRLLAGGWPHRYQRGQQE